MRILAKPGKPARIELTTHEKRTLATAGEICASIAANTSGEAKSEAEDAATNILCVRQRFAIETKTAEAEQAEPAA